MIKKSARINLKATQALPAGSSHFIESNVHRVVLADSSMSVILESVNCGVCGSDRSTPLFEARDYLYGNEGQWPVVRCLNCQVVFMNPRIPPTEIGWFYPKTYYTNQIATQRPKTWKQGVRDVALRLYFGYPPPNPPGIIAEIGARILGPVISRLASFRRHIRYVPLGKVLDAGCGNGVNLSTYQRLGWKTLGNEVGEDSARLARAAGHEIFTGELREAAYPTASFDAITLWDALEHIHNPADTLLELFRICRPGGLLYVYVPNYGSVYARIFRDKWFMFTAPLHYYHYTSESLSGLLCRAGFESVEIQYPLGAVGLQPTLSAATRESAWLHALVAQGPGAGLLRVVDRFLPRGHLLAIAQRPKEGRSGAS